MARKGKHSLVLRLALLSVHSAIVFLTQKASLYLGLSLSVNIGLHQVNMFMAVSKGTAPTAMLPAGHGSPDCLESNAGLG